MCGKGKCSDSLFQSSSLRDTKSHRNNLGSIFWICDEIKNWLLGLLIYSAVFIFISLLNYNHYVLFQCTFFFFAVLYSYLKYFL